MSILGGKTMRALILLFGLVSGLAHADTINFTWEVPTERADGSTLFSNEIAGYTLYEDGVQVQWIAGGTTTSTFHDYAAYGQPCYTISTTDNWGQEGAQSPEVCLNVFPAPPGAPVFLDASL
jgi:hypothetical protein